ncbi:Hsp20/alpha crystallin family protein [Halorubrum rubrum]|uniref:Hsp20/alpha crystallin family protein n=1 Tax=Halorubrum rubrum TaxID=1126240 RepID=A0ABD5R4L7_9EURY|nr:Hsp20/alpha crystallin family protein [Halorubrum rubrum]
MTRRDPLREIEELFERMDRELEKIGSGLDLPTDSSVAVDVIDGDETVTVIADLPGFAEEEISVELRDETLTVGATPSGEGDAAGEDASGVSDTDDAGDEERYRLRERRRGSVSRRIPLPAAVEPDAASATYDAGVLTVTLPKRSAADESGHRIDVN